MARKRKAQGSSKKKAKRPAAKRRPVVRRKPPKKKSPQRARARKALTPVKKDVLVSGIYGGDPTTGQIATPPPNA